MRGILLRILINALALGAAIYFVDGITAAGLTEGVSLIGVRELLVVATIFGVFNAIAKPILKLLTCPLQLLTLGLFTLVLNGLLLWLTAWVANEFGVGFHVDGILPAFLGTLIISVVSIVVDFLIPD
ncbi:MAG TPA: phage holin family protein [Caldilineae bacterium]|nr:phage holin family protein [Caldilineae bacterium]